MITEILRDELTVYTEANLSTDLFDGDGDRLDDFVRNLVIRVRDIIERDLGWRDENFKRIQR